MSNRFSKGFIKCAGCWGLSCNLVFSFGGTVVTQGMKPNVVEPGTNKPSPQKIFKDDADEFEFCVSHVRNEKLAVMRQSGLPLEKLKKMGADGNERIDRAMASFREVLKLTEEQCVSLRLLVPIVQKTAKDFLTRCLEFPGFNAKNVCNDATEIRKKRYYFIQSKNFTSIDSINHYLEKLRNLFNMFNAVLTGKAYVPPEGFTDAYDKMLKIREYYLSSKMKIMNTETMKIINNKIDMKEWLVESYYISALTKDIENAIKSIFNSVLSENIFTIAPVKPVEKVEELKLVLLKNYFLLRGARAITECINKKYAENFEDDRKNDKEKEGYKPVDEWNYEILVSEGDKEAGDFRQVKRVHKVNYSFTPYLLDNILSY